MKRRKKKKSLAFRIWAILLSILLLIGFGLLIYQVVKMNFVPSSINGAGACSFDFCVPD